jgi:23S rRNA (uridine2552-2'-O)-methyltransferase
VTRQAPPRGGRRPDRGLPSSHPASRRVGDVFSARAREEGYAARSVYKLKDIDARLRLLSPGGRVLDLGCAPGSWLKYAAERVGRQGRVVGIDLTPTPAPAPWAEALTEDVYRWDPTTLPECGRFDAVLSDMAPATTGVKVTDHARSLALAERALEIARQALRPGGLLLIKVFTGGDLRELEVALRREFASLSRERPPAVRRDSKEIYLLARGFKGPPPASTPTPGS